MLAGIAEHLDHQVGGAVDHLRMVDEVAGAVDEAAELHAALHPVEAAAECGARLARSEEHTSELQSLMRISYAVFCLKKKNKTKKIKKDKLLQTMTQIRT